MRTRYATPVDAQTVLIREGAWSPTGDVPDIGVTALKVLQTEDDARIQLVVTVPGNMPALDAREITLFRPYFNWEETASYWWATQYPAEFHLERVADGLEVGRLDKPGWVRPLGGIPSVRPDPSTPHVFGVYHACGSDAVVREGAFAPVPVPTRSGEPRLTHNTAQSYTVLARFPGCGPELNWLRLLRSPGVDHDARNAFVSEQEGMAILNRARDGAAIKLLHAGTLDTPALKGPYAAYRVPVGVEWSTLLNHLVVPTQRLPEVVRSLALDLTRTLGALHDLEMHIGVITPTMLRVRLVGSTGGSPAARATVVAMPGIVHARRKADLLGRVPEVDHAYLARHPGRLTERSATKDLQSLGYLLKSLLEAGDLTTHWLADTAQRMLDGEYEDERGLEAWLTEHPT